MNVYNNHVHTKMLRFFLYTVLAVLGFFFIAHPAYAHEVYVLTPDQISQALKAPELNIFSIISTHESRFIFWGVFSIFIVLCILLLSISKILERYLDPYLVKLKPYAPALGRITLGASLIASGYFGALFGPELPLSSIFATPFLILLSRCLLIISGTLLVMGHFIGLASLIGSILFMKGFLAYGWYMLTYFSYLSEILLITILGVGILQRFLNSYDIRAFSFFILRVLFGISLIYSSLYAKFIHGQLAIQTVIQRHLTNYFHFDPPFLVLGAFIIEIVIGIFFIIGFELRFTSLFMILFLSLSIAYFGETVWPHIILLGTAFTIFAHGYDKYTIERIFMRSGNQEPIL